VTAPVFLSAAWHDLALLNYEVDPTVLAPRVPKGTVLDTFEGRTLASLVAFRFRDTRVKGWRIPFHRHFLELNLRFYVRRDAPDGARGVVFVKEFVPLRFVAWVARFFYQENYARVPMWHESVAPVKEPASRGRLAYGIHRGGKRQGFSVEIEGEPALATDGSLESFLLEHYVGYTRRRDGSTREYAVEHPRWRVWRGHEPRLDLDVAALYGKEFAPFFAGPPASALVAEGSPVLVRAGRLLA
jgi:uncharacterized protein YqjF (DUF2071 family)